MNRKCGGLKGLTTERNSMSKDDKNDKQADNSSNFDEKGRFTVGNTVSTGRAKGTLNKATKDKREWVSKLLEDREDLIEEALDTLSKEDPDKALKHLLGLLEYTTPKLARSEITGAENGPIQLYLIDRLKDPEAEDDEDWDRGMGDSDD